MTDFSYALADIGEMTEEASFKLSVMQHDRALIDIFSARLKKKYIETL